ncbi:PAS domain-containing protein, partial [bacterium]|nr:PAS domain-containing protein [bacterium]
TFDSITDIIFITDKDYKLLMFNKTFADVFRMHPREVIGKTCYEVVHGKKEPWSTCPFKQTLATQKPASEEFFEPHLNIYLEVSTSPSFNEKGEVISAVHIVKDITERKKLEDKLKDYTKDLEEEVEERTKQLVMVNRHLEKADRAKSEFLASVSHELRTPLNSVIGFAEVLQDQKVGQLTQKQVRCVDNILTSGNHLLGLINDILDIAKIESGKMKLALSEFLFPELIKSINVILKETAFKKNITIKNHIVPQVSVIKADERKMKQIIYNLLSNAIKFTPDGGKIDINTDIKDKELWFSVVDTGIGIKQEEMNKLFKTFQQIDSEYTRKYGGTGLGLSLTKKMVELHGGKIWAESELGKGTTFTFTIPLREGCDDQKNDTYH